MSADRRPKRPVRFRALSTGFKDRRLPGAHFDTPLLVIGSRQDPPGFQEPHLRQTFGEWYPNVEFAFVTDAGHYPMQEAPIYLATLIEQFLDAHRAAENDDERRERRADC